jgi:hypothetical protein
MQPPALSRSGSIEGKRIEVILDGSESEHAARPGVLVLCHKNTEVKLREGDHADGCLLLGTNRSAD